jgi:hypothetical protein
MRRLGTVIVVLIMLTTSGVAVAHDGEKLGKVSFVTSCSPAAQGKFDRGVALLHSFWFGEAAKAFNDVAATDPACGMAYWGLAVTALGNPLGGAPNARDLATGVAAAEKAVTVGAKTQRERDYIAAIGTFYKDSGTIEHRPRALAYEKAMEQLSARYPDDREAAIFYALALNITLVPTDKTYANQLKAAAILEKAFAEQPEHPGVAHYLIHSYDFPPIAPKGLDAARRYAKIAPSAPHALHMPSHIFTRLGYWQESIDTNRASAQSAKAELAATQQGSGSYNALHAMDYMMYGFMQLGRDREAAALVEEIRGYRTVDVEHIASAYAFAAMPARYALERRRWSEAAALTLQPAQLGWKKFPQAEAITVFARGLGAARSGDAAAARKEADRLGELRDALTQMKVTYWAEQVEIQRQVTVAWIARAEGRNDEAQALLKAAADREDATEKHPVTPGAIMPARELLGDLLLEVGQPAQALTAYEASHRTEPNRFLGLFGAARAAELSGNAAKAKDYYGKLLTLASAADGDRPELKQAKAYLAKN